METKVPKDFFISYTHADQRWAEWIAWQLETEGYTTMLQAWDFVAGSHFVHEMDTATRQATRTIAVLSPDYLHLNLRFLNGRPRSHAIPREKKDCSCLYECAPVTWRAC